MKNVHKIISVLIIVIAFILRFYHLDRFPVALNWDEISHGYNAYSLIKTGKDQWSKSWPIFNFRAYGDYPTVLNMYLSIPFIKILGLNETSTRLVSALSGFGLVIVSYFLGKEIFKNKYSANLLMLLVAVSPWTFFPSRAVFQSTVAQFFLSLGMLFLIKANQKIKYLILGAIFTSLSTYAYHNTKIIVPLIIFIYLIIFNKHLKRQFYKNKRIFLISFLIFSALITPQIINTFNKDAQARSRWVFIINPASINQIEESRNNYQGNSIIAKLKYNRVTLFSTTLIKNYLGFVNPKTLFFDSTQNYQFNIPHTGVLYPFCLPLFYLGLFTYILRAFKKNRLSLFIISWFIIGLIPAVITTGDFPIIRAMSILPLPLIFITQGFTTTINLFKKKSTKRNVTILFLFLLIIQSVSYLKKYFYDYPKYYSHTWQYGYKEVVAYIKDNYNKYDQIIITKKYGEPHEFLLFYWPWDPLNYQIDLSKDWNYHTDWYWIDGFDKFKFVNDWEVKQITQNIDKTKKILLITSPNNYNQGSHLLNTINFLDNTPAFNIIEIK